MDKFESWNPEYIVFVLQPSPTNGVTPAPITLTFNSWVVMEVRQTDGIDLELWTGEYGFSNTVIKNNGISFVFAVDANYRPETRKKILQLVYYMNKGCDISFTFNGYNSTVVGFPHNNPNYTPTENTNQSITLDYTCIGIPSKYIDSTGGGNTILVGDISTIEITVKEAVSPLEFAPCLQLSMNDFSLYPWVLGDDGLGGYFIQTVILEASNTGLIEKFLSNPDGTINTVPPTSPGPISFGSINGSGTVMNYEDPFTSGIAMNQTYKIVIPNIKVLLKSGITCSITFEQQQYLEI